MQKIDRQVAFTGTKEVAAPLRFDPARLEAYLARAVAGFAGPLTVRQFKGGQSNPTYLLETPARRYVRHSRASSAVSAVDRGPCHQRAACRAFRGRAGELLPTRGRTPPFYVVRRGQVFGSVPGSRRASGGLHAR
jgi:hypothetical protein